MTKVILLLLVGFLIACAIGVSFTKSLLASVVIFMSYSLVMSIVWIFLESPDLAITEAAVGAGVTSVLFFVTLRKINAVEEEKAETDPRDEHTTMENGAVAELRRLQEDDAVPEGVMTDSSEGNVASNPEGGEQ